MLSLEKEKKMHWYVMRDLKRFNAKLPAYKHLQNEHIEVFTPMK
ncbi:MAG: transcriptional regulator, partial [Bacteroidales bacterium]